TTGAEGSRPLPPTPTPPLASSQVPRLVLPPCHTPVRSGFPSAARGTAPVAGALAVAGRRCGAVCADKNTGLRVIVTTKTADTAMSTRITAPPRRDYCLRRRCPPEGRRTASCPLAR